MEKGLKLKLKRIEKGLTQKQLREILKISPGKMVAIEKGEYRNLNLELMEKISKALETPVADLFLNE